MLAVASLAVGVVASLAAPSTHSGPADGHHTQADAALPGLDQLTAHNQLGPLGQVTGALGPVHGLLPL